MGFVSSRVVDTDGTAVEDDAVELLDTASSVLSRAHGDEAEATRAVGLTRSAWTAKDDLYSRAGRRQSRPSRRHQSERTHPRGRARGCGSKDQRHRAPGWRRHEGRWGDERGVRRDLPFPCDVSKSDGEASEGEQGSGAVSPRRTWGKASSGRHPRAVCVGNEAGPSYGGGCKGDSGRSAPRADSMLWGTPRVATVTTRSYAWW